MYMAGVEVLTAVHDARGRLGHGAQVPAFHDSTRAAVEPIPVTAARSAAGSAGVLG